MQAGVGFSSMNCRLTHLMVFVLIVQGVEEHEERKEEP